MTHKERLREQNLSLLRYLKWVITLSKVGYREEGDQLFMGTQWKDKGPWPQGVVRENSGEAVASPSMVIIKTYLENSWAAWFNLKLALHKAEVLKRGPPWSSFQAKFFCDHMFVVCIYWHEVCVCKLGELPYIPDTHTQLLPSLSEKVGMLSQQLQP